MAEKEEVIGTTVGRVAVLCNIGIVAGRGGGGPSASRCVYYLFSL